MASNSQNSTQTPSAQSWTIGRATDCDLVCPEPTVSGHHCRLIREGEHFWVEDLNSPNGVYVNGNRVPPGQMVHLPPDSQVTLGRQVPMRWPQFSASSSGSGQSPNPAPIQPPPPGSRVINIGRAP